MHARSLALSIAPLFAATLAHAQAPGDSAPETTYVAPVVAPVMTPIAAPVQPACPVPVRAPQQSVMAHPWSVGLSIGSLGLVPDHARDDRTTFAIGELALRLRVHPHIELELTAGGGRERTDDGKDGDLEVAEVAVAARYRFVPEAAWNWFVMGGLGVATITRHGATDRERNDAAQPMAMVGIGLERRFRHLAFQAEARLVGLGERDDRDDVVLDRTSATTVAPSPTGSTVPAQAGGSLSIGVSYSF